MTGVVIGGACLSRLERPREEALLSSRRSVAPRLSGSMRYIARELWKKAQKEDGREDDGGEEARARRRREVTKKSKKTSLNVEIRIRFFL